MSIVNTSKYPLQIINAGLFRGGTASLSLALKELGFGPTWHLITNTSELTGKGSKWWLQNNITEKLKNGETVDFDQWFQQIQCKSVMDSPIVFYWQQIFAQYPQSKVIISVRPFEKWSKSYINILEKFTDIGMQIVVKIDPFTNMLMKQWDIAHVGKEYNGISQLISLNKSKLKTILKEDIYDKQIETAKKIVPKEQLLIFHPNQGWKPLCKFLNIPIPNKPFPNMNSTKQWNVFGYEWKKKAILSKINVLYVVGFIVLLTYSVYFLFRN
eukprot:370524_1